MIEVLLLMAELLNMEENEIQDLTTTNALRLFKEFSSIS
jgi:Tat protein secretion system quality control protein TatD with DNase activity